METPLQMNANVANACQHYKVIICQCCVYILFHCPKVAKKSQLLDVKATMFNVLLTLNPPNLTLTLGFMEWS